MNQLNSNQVSLSDDRSIEMTFSLHDIATLAEQSSKKLKVKIDREIAYSSDRAEDSIQDLASKSEFIDSLVSTAISQYSTEEKTDKFTKEALDNPSFTVEIEDKKIIHFKKKRGFDVLDRSALLNLSAQINVDREQQSDGVDVHAAVQSQLETLSNEAQSVLLPDEVGEKKDKSSPASLGLGEFEDGQMEVEPELLAVDGGLLDGGLLEDGHHVDVDLVDSEETLLAAIESFLSEYGQKGALQSYVEAKTADLGIEVSDAASDFYALSNASIQSYWDRANALEVDLPEGIQSRLETLSNEAQSVLLFADAVDEKIERFPTMEEAHPGAIAQPGAPHIDAASVGFMQFAEVLPAAQQEWLVEAVEGFKSSGIAQAVMDYGVPAAKAAMQKTKELGADARERALADSVVAMLDEVGADGSDGPERLQTEKYDLARDDSGYMVSDRETGGRLAHFTYDTLKGPTFTQNDLSIADQFEFLKAGAVIAKDRAKEGAEKGWAIAKDVASRAKDDVLIVKEFGEDTYEKLQGVAQQLGNMAPAGTREAVQQFQAKKVDDVAQALTRSKAAVTQAGKSVFEGAQLTFARTRSDVGEQIQISTREGQELFSRTTEKVAEGVKTTIKNGFSKAGMSSLFQKAKQLNLSKGENSKSKKKDLQEVGR